MMTIDFSHMSKAVFYSARFSLIEHRVYAKWIITKKRKQTLQVDMNEETFRSVWDALNEIPDFASRRVAIDPIERNQQINPRIHYGVQAVSNIGGKHENCLYKISADSASPAFKEWLAKLGYIGE
jgi:hypothetical protein